MPNIIIIFFIRFYQIFISPFLGRNCRFYPSCSKYAIESFQKNNFVMAVALTFYRILRCNPLGGSGLDLVPEKIKQQHENQGR